MLAVGLLAVLLAASRLPSQTVERCQACHAEQVRHYAATGMGRSAGRAEGLPSGEFRHALSKTLFRVTGATSGMIHEAERGGNQTRYGVEWFIGSGNQGRSFLLRQGDSLFQSPVAWYRGRNGYGMAPGYENDRSPDFYRPVTPDCLFCHTGRSEPLPNTQNRYRQPALTEAAIHCDRCHGDSSAHLARPTRANIINPARLSGAIRDSVCEQCHLGGEARIPNAGAYFTDYQPGMLLEEVFSVYVKAGDDATNRFRVVSHVEQLALSACATASSGKLWCGSCHRIHSSPNERPAYAREGCLSCHRRGLPTGEEHQTGNCIACHMPRKAAWDGGHTAFTDHRIVRRPSKDPPPESIRADTGRLRAWREPAPRWRTRNLGLAYISAGERNASAWQINEGFRLLTQAPNSDTADAAVDTALGLVLLLKRRPEEALRFFERALAGNKSDSRAQLNLGVAAYAAGRYSEAVAALEEALAIEPLLEEAHRLLVEVHSARGDRKQQDAVLGRYRRLFGKRLLR
jgi:hypothetical protein